MLTDAEFTLADYNDKVVRTWRMNEMTAHDNILEIDLTQEETLSFVPSLHKGQLRVKVLGGGVMASKKMPVNVKDLLSEEVL